MRQSGTVAGAATMLAVTTSVFAADGLSPTARTTVVPSLLRSAIAAADRTVDVPLEADGRSLTLRIAPHSMRSAAFRVLVDDGLGQLTEVEAPASRTFIGTVLESPGSVVRAAAVDDGVAAAFTFGGERWFVQPVDDAGTHAVFSQGDIEPSDATCGVTDEHVHEAPPPAAPEGGIAGLNCQWLTQIACDADFEFFQSNGSSVPNTVADIENVLSGVIGIYNDDCDIDFVITEIIVRSNVNDPYTTSGASALLEQFAAEWAVNQTAIQRDIAHLFTGKNLSGGTIGIAYLEGLCSSGTGYGLSQSKWSNNYANRISVTAHEIGHNFSATHCNGQPDCGVMCASIGGCAGSITVFGANSAAQITSFADSAPCLGPEAPPSVNASDGTTCGAVTVLFTPAPSATTHTIYRAVNSGDPANAVVVQANATSPYVDTNVALGTLYGYWVTATDADGCESSLNNVDFGFAPVLVAAPTFVAATDGTQCGQVTVVWNAAAGASSFEIWRGGSSSSAEATFLADDGASPYADASAVPGQVYFYWVRSANACGDPGPFGASDSGTRKAAPAAGEPSATDDECPGVTVTWNAVGGATSYALFRGTSSDPAQATLLVANAVSPTIDNSAAAATMYWYFVQSANNCGAGTLGVGDPGSATGGIADLNGDCVVDGADLGILLGNWAGAGIGDLDGNGMVDGGDLGLLLGAWT